MPDYEYAVQDRCNNPHGDYPVLYEGRPEQNICGAQKKMSTKAKDMPLLTFG